MASVIRDLRAIVSPGENGPRRSQQALAIFMRSIPIRLVHRRSDSAIPLRMRPYLAFGTILVLVLLGVLGYVHSDSFHPRAQNYIHVNDKLMHFIAFTIVRNELTRPLALSLIHI